MNTLEATTKAADWFLVGHLSAHMSAITMQDTATVTNVARPSEVWVPAELLKSMSSGTTPRDGDDGRHHVLGKSPKVVAVEVRRQPLVGIGLAPPTDDPFHCALPLPVECSFPPERDFGSNDELP